MKNNDHKCIKCGGWLNENHSCDTCQIEDLKRQLLLLSLAHKQAVDENIKLRIELAKHTG